VEELTEQDTAGSPFDEGHRWTNRSPGELVEELQEITQLLFEQVQTVAVAAVAIAEQQQLGSMLVVVLRFMCRRHIRPHQAGRLDVARSQIADLAGTAPDKSLQSDRFALGKKGRTADRRQVSTTRYQMDLQLMGDTGCELPANSREIQEPDCPRSTNVATVGTVAATDDSEPRAGRLELDPDLTMILAAWPTLSAAIKAGILATIRRVSGVS
jgi:hypothetical protein